MSRRIQKTLFSVLVLVLVAAPAWSQTFLQQIAGGSTKFFELSVTTSGQFTTTVMWNRADTFMFTVMTCQGVGDTLDWAVSFPEQVRTLRMDVGIFSGLDCVLGLDSDKTAAFALNFQELAPDGLVDAVRTELREVDPKNVDPKLLARAEELVRRARAMRPTPPETVAER